jgi:hypothetical protein
MPFAAIFFFREVRDKDRDPQYNFPENCVFPPQGGKREEKP